MSDGPQWELSKENTAPLERGRNVKSLMKRNNETTQERLEKEQLLQQYERLVADGTQADPLMHWLSYIQFHQEAFPAQDQFCLLERCTRALLGNREYANDLRFIRVCVTYADKTQAPGDVFKYLHAQQVGTSTALFWIAWAWVAEHKGDYAFAEKVYLKGLAKEAAPIKLLQQRHKQFQRRMSRHWLNTSQQRPDVEEEITSSGRATLGGLDEERVRRNDRRVRSREHDPELSLDRGMRTFQDRQAKRVPQLENNGAVITAGGFQIFVDENVERQVGYDLDRTTAHERELETEAERNQENTLAAEAWNARGAYATRYGAPILGAPRPLSFAVHVDAECIAQNEQQKSDEQAQFDRMRKDRDRALQEREGEDMAEKLTKDPMMYIRDPSKLVIEESKPKASVSCGFNKKLLAKDLSGQEQCFEEQRMLARFYRLNSQADNFNRLLHDESRIEEESIEDIEMEEDDDQERVASNPRRTLFALNTSVDSRSNSFILNASTASSTVNERDAVGVLGAKEEETINTKLAMRELSMMFSSPAMGLGHGESRASQRPRLDNNDDHSETGSYSLIGLADDGHHCEVNNSLFQEEENDENANRTENPHARTNASRSFRTSVLRPMDDDRRMMAMHTAAPMDDAGFEIFADRSFNDDSKLHSEDQIPPSIGFSIFVDDSTKKPADSCFSIFVDEGDDSVTKPTADGISIFVDEVEPVKKPAAKLIEKIPFSIYQGSDDSDSESRDSGDSVGAGDTASFSIFGEAMDALRDVSTRRRRRTSTILPETIDLPQQADIEVNGILNNSTIDTGAILTGDSPAFGDISQIVRDDVSRFVQQSPTLAINTLKPANAVEYIALHKDDIRTSLRKLDQEARKTSMRRPFSRDAEELDLGVLLSTKGTVRDMPTQSMPRALKKSTSTQGSAINVGNKSGVVKHELGRGSYGVVVLLETDEAEVTAGAKGIVAVKAQAPTDCLAWEYEVLRRLEERVSPHCTITPGSPFPFPLPLSFVALADGGLLGMTAGSATGMNLVDIVNVYRICERGPVPEIIAMHYTARMLKHMETLHWHGKILHCDAKPDNWVLMTSQAAFEGCGSMLEASDLMLVDFGRSVDMSTCAKNGIDAMNIKLHGEATTEDLACVAMRRGYVWSFDIDTFGICASAHVLLYGVDLEIEQASDRRWKPRKALRRYWQGELWSELFDTLLNLDEGTQTATGSRPGSLRCLRQKLESYLNGKSRELESLLKHQSRILPKTRPGS